MEKQNEKDEYLELGIAASNVLYAMAVLLAIGMLINWLFY